MARWTAAVLAIVYGFAKINGSQFTVLDSDRGNVAQQGSLADAGVPAIRYAD